VLRVNVNETTSDVLARIATYGSFSNKNCSIYKAGIHKWYYTTYNVEVKDMGTLIPKWDSRIEGTIDGVVDDGIMDIRYPTTMYKALTHHIKKIERGWIPDKFYHDHLFLDHYIQMQANMKICDKLWCDYIVFVPTNNEIYIERVAFDDNYWNLVIWPQINNFLSYSLGPMLKAAQ
jgi:hypothetical protein